MSEIRVEAEAYIEDIDPVLIETDKLKPHELIVSHEFQVRLNEVLDTWGFEKPISVSIQGGVVLDGHHRLAAAAFLGATKIPCALIDYYKEQEVQLDTWQIIVKGDVQYLLERIKNELEPQVIPVVSAEHGWKRLDNTADDLLLVDPHNEQYLILKFDPGKILGVIDEEEQNKKAVLRFVDTRAGAMHFIENEYDFALLRKPIPKSLVVKKAWNGELVSPKTTRHVFKRKGIRKHFSFGEMGIDEEKLSRWLEEGTGHRFPTERQLSH